MTAILGLANFLMRLAAFAAPSVRASWVRAMTSEYLFLPTGPRRLSWAAGCAATSLGWRGREELAYALMLAALPFFWNAVLSPLAVALAEKLSAHHLSSGALSAFDVVFIAVVAFLLCARWPQRAAFTIAAVWLLTVGAVATGTLGLLQLAYFNGVGGAFDLTAPTIIALFGFTLWPAVLAGAAGWAAARGRAGFAAMTCFLMIVYLVATISWPSSSTLKLLAMIAVLSLLAGLAASFVSTIVQMRAAWRMSQAR
jgi:hypothetical protein